MHAHARTRVRNLCTRMALLSLRRLDTAHHQEGRHTVSVLWRLVGHCLDGESEAPEEGSH